MKISRWLALAAAVISLVLPAGGCEKKAGKDGGPIRIGHFASLTGPTATFGISADRGVRMAFDEINAQGGVLGRQVAVLTEDDQSRPEEARTAALKLIRQDEVVALLGEVASSASLAAAPEAQRAQVPMVSPASTNPDVTKVGDYIFRTCFIDPFQGGTMARFAFEDLGLRKVAIFKDVKNDYSVGLARFFREAFTNMGGEIVAEEDYSAGDTDFRAQLTKIRESKPEGVYVPGYYTEVGLIARQARELGLDVPLMGGDGWDSPTTLEVGGEAVNGSYFTNHYSPEDPDEKVQQFIARFKEKYDGTVPDAMAVLGYDAARLVADAMSRANTTDAAPLRNAIAATKRFPGVSGEITIDENRNAEKPIVILKIENGGVHFHKRLMP